MKAMKRSYAFGAVVLLLTLCLMLAVGTLTVFAETPAAFEVVWSDQTESVYGEPCHTVTAKYVDGDGQEHTATVSGFPTLGDGEVLNAGVYSLTATPADPAHVLTNATATYTVTPKTVTVVWGGLANEYGEATNVTAYYTNVHGDQILLTISGKPDVANAGTYDLTVVTDDANYVLEGTTATYTVTPKAVSAVWEGALESIYGNAVGEVKAYYEDVLGGKVFLTVVGMPDAASNAGYYALAVWASDPNYAVSVTTAVYRVAPKEVEVVWNGVFTQTYGENVGHITATYNGIDATVLGMPVEGANAGCYVLTAVPVDGNYVLTNATREYTVTPKRVSVVWQGELASDHGAALSKVSVSCTENGVTLLLEGMPDSNAEAGGYVLRAVCADGNYQLINDTKVYVIRDMQVINDLKSENEQLKGQNSTLTTQNEALQNKISALETKVSTLKTEINALSTENAALSGKITELQSKINALTAEIGELEAAIAQLTGQIGTMDGDIKALETENGALKQEITLLREKIAALTGEVQGLQTQVSLLQDGIGELKEQDKLKVVAIIILAVALLLMIAGAMFYLNKGKGTPAPAATARAPMTDAECNAVGKGIRNAIRRGEDIYNDLVTRNSGLDANGAVRNQFDGWENIMIGAMQDYVPEVGEPFDRYSMRDVSKDDEGGDYVTRVKEPGKRVGSCIVFPAQVITGERL